MQVPFGYISAVRDWMKIEGTVQKPEKELPSRPITGLNCTKSEQSGLRFWGLFQKICGTPESFFENCFVYNFCNLAFFHATGRNITPAELKGEEKKLVQEISNEGLIKAIELIKPEIVISIGNYVDDRVRSLLKRKLIKDSIQLKIISHPSPRSLNNTNWNEKAEKWLIENEIIKYLK